jgi:hypothetical protein
MKKIILVLLLTSLTLSLNAQFGVPGHHNKTDDREYALGVIGADNDGFYSLRKKEQTLTVERYNKKSLIKEWSTDIAAPKGFEMSSLFRGYIGGVKNKQIWVFIPAARDNKFTLLLQTISTDGKLITPQPQEFLALDVDRHQVGNWEHTLKYQNIFRWSFSPDSSKALLWVYATNTETFIIEKNSTRGAVIDLNNFTVISDKLPKKYNNNYITPKYFAVSNEGRVACYFYHTVDKDTYGVLGLYNKSIYDSNPASIVPTNIPGEDVVGSGITFDKKNKLLYSAVVNNGDKKNAAIYSMQYDILSSKVDFETSQFMTDAWAAKHDPSKSKTILVAKKGMYSGPALGPERNYKFQFNYLSNGGYIISAFQIGGFNKDRVHHCLDDAIITKIAASGKIEWVKILPISVAILGGFNKDGLINYLNCTYSNNKMYYVFDNNVADEKNIDLNKADTGKETETVSDFIGENINTSCVTIDMYGNLQRTTICNNKDKGFNPSPATILLDKNKMLLQFLNNKKEQTFSVFNLQ